MRRTQSTSFQSLEPRKLFAADLVTNMEVPAGYYADGDMFDINVIVTNRGKSKAEYPFFTQLIASKDKTLGNADDIEMFSTATFLPQNAGKTVDTDALVNISDDWESGDYYIAAKVDSMGIIGESNEDNNVTWTAKPVIRIVTKKLTDNNIFGTTKDDVITIGENWANTVVTLNGVSKFCDNLDFKQYNIDARAGNDKVYVSTDRLNSRLFVTGAGGNDTLIGGKANDEISGANGKDKVWGGEGNDYLLGGAQNDTLDGEAGWDTLSGAGGNDRLISLSGKDKLFGGAGNDTFLARDTTSNFDNDPDTISGGAGVDKAQYDKVDEKTSIESVIA